MKIEINLLKDIYDHLEDEISREIFKNRLMHSITGDDRYIVKTIENSLWGGVLSRKLKEAADKSNLVIFGAGTWGKHIFRYNKNYPWKCFVDNFVEESEILGLPVINGNDFLNYYDNEFIVIAASKDYKEVFEQLLAAEVPQNNILNAGELIDDFRYKQYFDLEYLQPAEGKEVFVDVGGYDGMSSVNFKTWSKTKDSFAYVWEPDQSNIERCQKNLDAANIDYCMIPKVAWDEETMLCFRATGGSASRVAEMAEGDKIKASTIDKYLENEKVTFIKMDVEGSELKALKGAETVITRNKPKLAISIYHKKEDIWEIPEIILKYNTNYRLFLRHYSLAHTETILYAIP